MSKKDDRPLTAKQFAFCKHYVSADCYGNATEAARRAGYKGNDATLGAVGSENLRKPRIRAELERMMDEATSGANVTIERVLRDIDRRGRQAEQQGNTSAALRACELQGKYLKMFVDRIEHVETIDQISDDMLLQLINELMGRDANLLAAATRDGAQDGALPGTPGAETAH